MSVWATTEASEIKRELRWDAEFYVNPYNEFLEELFQQQIQWITLQEAARRLTSGHTPLRHDVSRGDTPFVTVECVDPLWLDIGKTKRVWAYQANGELSRVQVKRGDILITIKRRIALSCPILRDPGLMVVNQDVVVMTPKRGLRPAFIAAVMNSRVGQYPSLTKRYRANEPVHQRHHARASARTHPPD